MRQRLLTPAFFFFFSVSFNVRQFVLGFATQFILTNGESFSQTRRLGAGICCAIKLTGGKRSGKQFQQKGKISYDR